jgi:hypothetical protein
MVAIPSAEAARAAWDALPYDVRASVIERAAKGWGDPDPAVAAIAVGRARAEEWPWWRTAMFGAGRCLWVGACLAFLVVGLKGWPVLAGPAGVGLLLYKGAPRLCTGARLPHATESANLRVLLAAPDAEVSSPTVPRPVFTSRRVAVATAEVIGIAAVAIGAIELSGARGGVLGDLKHHGIGFLIGIAVVVAILTYQFRRHPIRARAAEDGLWFNWRRKPIPWRDVTDVSLKGSNVVWSLRDGTTAEMIVAGLGRQPENVYLPARAYIEAAKQAA